MALSRRLTRSPNGARFDRRIVPLRKRSDAPLSGPADRAAAASHRWSALYSIHMEGCLRDDKGCAYSPNLSATAARPAGIPSSMSLSADGIKVLGSPLGTPQYTAQFLSDAVDSSIQT